MIAYYLNSLAIARLGFSGCWASPSVAATQATAALYVSATGTMFARDFYRHYLNPAATDREQKLFGRIGVGFTMLFALLFATYAPHAEAEIGALALPFALQLLPLALAVCWFPWITPQAAISGLIAGLVAVLFTDKLGLSLAEFFEIDIPWGRWPWTIHSAGWGIVLNVAVCLLFSLMTQKRSRHEHRMRYHEYLAEAAPRPQRCGSGDRSPGWRHWRGSSSRWGLDRCSASICSALPMPGHKGGCSASPPSGPGRSSAGRWASFSSGCRLSAWSVAAPVAAYRTGGRSHQRREAYESAKQEG